MTDLVFGVHAVSSALAHNPGDCLRILVVRDTASSRLEALRNQARQLGVPEILVERKRLDSRCQGVHQDVAMEMRPFRGLDEKALMNMVAARHDLLLLVLDGVTDPHNLGACIRSAEAAGAAGLLIAKDKSAPVNATVRKVAAGSAERLPVFVVTNLARALEKCRAEGVWVTGLASEGVVSLWDLDLTGRTAIVLGSEGKGMRRLTREHCDHLACIPMAGEIESLNVSVAAGIALFESRRQRLYARID